MKIVLTLNFNPLSIKEGKVEITISPGAVPVYSFPGRKVERILPDLLLTEVLGRLSKALPLAVRRLFRSCDM